MIKELFSMSFFSIVFNDIIGNAVLCVACVLLLSYLRAVPPQFEKARMVMAGIVLSVGAFFSRFIAHFFTPHAEEGEPPMIQQALSNFVLHMDFADLTEEQKMCLILELLNSVIGIISICVGAFILMKIFKAKHITPMIVIQVAGFLLKELLKTPCEKRIIAILNNELFNQNGFNVCERLEQLNRADAFMHGYNGFGYGCFMIAMIVLYLLVTDYKYNVSWTKKANILKILKHLGSLVALIAAYMLVNVAGDILIAHCGIIETTNTVSMNIICDLLINFFLAASLLAVPLRTYKIMRSEIQNDFFEEKRSDEIKLIHHSISQPMHEGLKKFIHDLPMHFNSIEILAAQKGEDDIVQYVKDLNIELEEAKCGFSTGNAHLDKILTDEQKFAEENGANIVFKGMFPNDGIKQKDISTIFYNLLKNAVEACSFVTGKREIVITSRINGGRVRVTVSNPFEHKIHKSREKLLTTKKEREFHGYGLSNVAKAAEKEEYDGSFWIEDKNGIFYANFDMKYIH